MASVLAPFEPDSMIEKATYVAQVLKALANPSRLLVLCRLVEVGESRVGDLVEFVGLSQSALSQHLAVMREEGIIAFERDGQTLHYRIADPRVGSLLGTLYRLYCATSEDKQP